MKIIYQIPGYILCLLGGFFLSWGGIIIRLFETEDVWQILTIRSVFFITALIFFLLVYVITLIAFFSFMLGTFTNKGNKMNTQISDLVNLGAVNPVLAFSVVFILFSMIGLPPLAGFFAKYYLFLSMIQSELYMIAIIGVLSSVVAAFYYIRLIKVMFFEVSPNYLTYKSMDKVNSLILSSSLFILVFLFAWPHPVLSCIHNIAITLVL